MSEFHPHPLLTSLRVRRLAAPFEADRPGASGQTEIERGTPMSGLSIDTQRIAGARMGVSDVGASLAREIATMHDLLGQIRSGWQSSEAAPRFAAAMEGHLADAATLKDALLGQGAALSTAAQRFGETEFALADAVPAVG